jgi:hypothetical protein
MQIRTALRFYLNPVRIAVIKKKQPTTYVVEACEERNFYTQLVGM